MRLGHLSVGTLSNKLIDMNAAHACYSNLRTFSGLVGGARTPTHKYIAMAAPSHYASRSSLGTFTDSLSSAGLLTHLRPLHRTPRHRPRPTLQHPLSTMAFEPHTIFFGGTRSIPPSPAESTRALPPRCMLEMPLLGVHIVQFSL